MAIRVVVEGAAGSGKSVVMTLIQEALNKAGFNAEINPDPYDVSEQRPIEECLRIVPLLRSRDVELVQKNVRSV